MFKLQSEISHFAKQLGEDAHKHLAIARNNAAYAKAIKQVCGPNVAMADLILEHTNAFYVRRDDVMRKGAHKDKPYIVCEACIDDPMVRSELNSYRELLKMTLMYDNIHCDEFRIIPAKGGMRERHPFVKYTSSSKNNVDSVAKDAASRIAHEDSSQKTLVDTVKRALCLVYGKEAHIIFDCIAGIELKPVIGKRQDAYRQPHRYYWLTLRASNERIAKLFVTHKQEIIARARDLGLNINAISVSTEPADSSSR